MRFLLETIRMGLRNLALHKLRSLLTTLGIIFGVASVITMVAIGEGNKQKALYNIRQLGAQNIILRSIKPSDGNQTSGSARQWLIAYGLTRSEQRRMKATIKGIEEIVPLKLVATSISHQQYKSPAAIFGTKPALLDVTRMTIARGRYITEEDLLAANNNIVVLGANVATKLFPLDDPLGNWVRINQQAFQVVGVLATVGLAGGAGTALVGRDLNFDVHIPMAAARARFGDQRVRFKSGSFEATQVELTELYVKVAKQEWVSMVADQIKLLLDKNHKIKGDVTMVVPLELLKQAERTQKLFNTLMIAIASISLLVGGIGIMNIMLATVTERTREIGIRRALGATRQHIVMQFLVETSVLSCLGGLMGIALGLATAGILTFLHTKYPSIEKPQVTTWSVVSSFAVATAVGIIFGLYPAVKAAQQDPIVALRHD